MSIQDEIYNANQQLAQFSERINQLIRERAEVEEIIPGLSRAAQTLENDVQEHLTNVRNKFGCLKHKTKLEERYLSLVQETLYGNQMIQAIQELYDEAEQQRCRMREIEHAITNCKASMNTVQASLEQLKLQEQDSVEGI